MMNLYKECHPGGVTLQKSNELNRGETIKILVKYHVPRSNRSLIISQEMKL